MDHPSRAVSQSLRRKPPPSYDQHLPLTPEVGRDLQDVSTPSTPPTYTELFEDSQIAAVRSKNPNLQPLSPKERETVDRRMRRSIDPSEIPKMLPTPPPTQQATNVRHSIGSVTDLKSKFKRFSSLSSRPSSTETTQNFWKYHILELGDDLYLSTNPDSKHLYCRHSPGVHVQLMFPLPKGAKTRDTTGKSGFKMVFRDQDDEKVFMTITKRGDGRQFAMDGEKRMFEAKDGEIVSVDDPVDRMTGIADEIEIDELKGKYFEPSGVIPVRFRLKDEKATWTVGSIPQYKPGTSKLKNKRYIYFTSQSDKILACFRPHEDRTKKKLIKKLNSTRQASTLVQREDDQSVITTGKEAVYYTPKDGVFQQDPPDDAPNSDKLGWITIFEDTEVFNTPGNWELVLGFTLALGVSRVMEEKLSS